MDNILLKLTEIEMEVENIEPSRKEELLDLVDAFRASIIQMLKSEPTGDEDKDLAEGEGKPFNV